MPRRRFFPRFRRACSQNNKQELPHEKVTCRRGDRCGFGHAHCLPWPRTAEHAIDRRQQRQLPAGQPIGSGNWFIDASVGRTDGYSRNSDFGSGFGSGSGNLFRNSNGRRTGYGLLGGYRWKAGPDLGLGIEAGYSDLGNYKLSNLGNGGPVNQASRENALRGWMLGANGRINVLPQWYVSAHAGYFHANNNGGAYNDTLNQDLFHGGERGGYYAGIGTG